jgi:hypothetical protein
MDSLFNDKSENTKKERIRFLTKIGVIDLENYDVLNNIKNIFDTFIYNSNSKGTQKTRIFHIIEFLKLTDNKDLLDLYKKNSTGIINAAIDIEKSNTTTKQDRYIKLDILQNNLKEFTPKKLTLKMFMLLTRKEQVNYISKLANYILLSLYVFTPAIRNNYYGLNVIDNKNMIDKKSNLNYMIVNKASVYLYLQNYKNHHSLGSIRIDIDKETQKLIKSYITLLEFLLGKMPEYFLYHISNNKIEPLKENATKNKIIDLSKQVFNTPLSINDYRHIWEISIQNSEEYKNMSYIQKEKTHRKLLHSLDTAMKYNIL